MAVKLSELFNSFNKKELKLIAGIKGINNVVRWVHMVEGINISLFLDEQELAFTTGIALKEENELFELVKCSYEHKASGMVINTGPYIKEIPSEIIKFCEKNNFPLFEAPWDVYIAEIMKKLCYQITISDRITFELSAAIKNAIFLSDQKDMYIPQLERYGFRPEWSYRILVLDIIRIDKKSLTEKRKDELLKKIENFITYKYRYTASLELNNKIVLLFANYREEKINTIIKEFTENITKIINENENYYLSIGNETESIRELHESYKQALNTFKILLKKNQPNSVCNYNELGIYKLLLAIENQDIIKEYYEETLGELEKHDEINGTDYLEVLRHYLENNGSVKLVAENLFYHRNTVGYKLQKIDEIIGGNLSYQEFRLKCHIALMLKEIF